MALGFCFLEMSKIDKPVAGWGGRKKAQIINIRNERDDTRTVYRFFFFLEKLIGRDY